MSPPSVLRHVVPYELDVLHARTMYWAGDGRGYLDELVRLVRMCKRMARKGGLGDGHIGGGAADEKGDARTVWTERGMRTGMMVVTQLVEMQVRYHLWFSPMCIQFDVEQGLYRCPLHVTPASF